ncbi:MAG: DNA-binding CsgD family transcriptional regulator [Saprospiraceae bacterium]
MSRLLLLIFILFFSLALNAQEVPKITSYTATDYRAANQNWMITQDCVGNLYVANTEGLLIFNGFQWQTMQLPGNQIARSVYRDADCRIYVGGYETFGYINLENRFVPEYVPVADSLLRNTKQEIWKIFGSSEELFFQSFSHFFSLKEEAVTSIALPGNIMFGNIVDDRTFIPKVEGGMYEFTERVKEIFNASSLPIGVKISAVCTGISEGELLIGTQNSGLYQTEAGEILPLNSVLNRTLKQEQINKIIRLRNGDYAIGTILNGVYITSDLKAVIYHINKLNGLTNNTVLSLFEDRDGNLWVGTDKGLSRLALQSPLEFYYDKQGKLGTVYTHIEYSGNFYLGTNQGVFRADENKEFALIEKSQGQVWSFLHTGEDLICGHNEGIYVIKNKEFNRISATSGGWCMRQVDERRILISTYTGLILLEKNEDGIWLEKKYVKGETAIKDFILKDNTLIGHHPNQGIILFEFTSDFSHILNQRTISDQDGTNFLSGVKILSSGLIITKDSRLQVVGLILKPISNDSLFNDNSPELRYFSFAQSISKMEKIEEPVTFPNSTNDNSFVFAFEEGYIRIPKNYPLIDMVIDLPQIDYLLQQNQMLSANQNSFTFAPQENDLSIYFSNSTFSESTAHRFRYKLQGWDKKDYPFPDSGILKFLNLHDGEYRLLLIDQESRKETEVLSFTVRPHWYESWPGGVLYFLLISGFLYILNLRNKAKLRRQAEELKAEQNKRLESERINAKNEQLEKELTYKSKMLANSTMTLIQKNRMLADLKEMIEKEGSKPTAGNLQKQKIFNLIDRNINSDSDWQVFERNFAAVHKDFFETLKNNHPDITAGELRLAAYVRLNLSSKEIAPLLNISFRSVENKRYRLRKRLGITKADSLKNYLMRL